MKKKMMMNRILAALFLLLPTGLAAQTDASVHYKSPRVHYYIDADECINDKGYVDIALAAWKGADVWVMITLDDGNIIFRRRPGADFFYGTTPGHDTPADFTRDEAVAALNRWLSLTCSITEQDRKYEHLGYSMPCYIRMADAPLESCAGIDTHSVFGVDSDYVGMRFLHSGEHTRGTEMTLWMTRDHEFAILYRTGNPPCIEPETGYANYTTLLGVDIDEYLPQTDEPEGILFLGTRIPAPLDKVAESLRGQGFVELEERGADEVWDQYNAAMGGMLGSSANSRLMRGRFYGAPCEVTLHANPESGEVETIEGCLTASYPTLESLREDFRRFY